jgi:glycine/D-amino acid oxidase-like deaminating enzyme
MSFDVAVIGAGIVGAACASSLASAGLSVIVIDASGVATGTTAAGMGHIVLMDDSEAQFALTRYSQQLWDQLASEMPASAEYQHRGTIWVAADDDEMTEVPRKRDLYSAYGLSVEILDEQGLREAEPNLRDGLAGGLLVRGDSVVYQLTATRFLLEKAKADGCVTRLYEKVDAITDDGVRLANGECIAAAKVVNAAGVNAPALSPDIAIVKRKGHLVITDRYPDFCRHQIVETGYLASAHAMTSESVAFNVQPRATGQLLVGSSRELVGWDPSVNLRVVGRMLARAFEFVPSLARLSAIRTWTGFRPATADKLPLVGRWSETDGLWIAAGHEGLGITTALATGRLLADLVAGRETTIDARPYDPNRAIPEGHA